MNFQIDKSKAINSMLYIIKELNEKKETPSIHKVMKLMYFADRIHLVEYGLPITGDTYQKMEFGPVPSFANHIANDRIELRKGIIKREGKNLVANIEPDMDDLSISEVKCLDESINKYSKYTFSELTKISHDYAWNSSDRVIDYIKIAEEGGADKEMLNYIKEQIINSNLSFC